MGHIYGTSCCGMKDYEGINKDFSGSAGPERFYVDIYNFYRDTAQFAAITITEVRAARNMPRIPPDDWVEDMISTGRADDEEEAYDIWEDRLDSTYDEENNVLSAVVAAAEEYELGTAYYTDWVKNPNSGNEIRPVVFMPDWERVKWYVTVGPGVEFVRKEKARRW